MDLDFLKSLPLPFWLWVVVWATFTLIPLGVNVLFAAGVAGDASELEREGGRTFCVGPVVWALATVFGGVFVAFLYWAIHRSALRRVAVVSGGAQHPLSILTDRDS